MADKPEIKSLFSKIKEYKSLLKITSIEDYQVKVFDRNLTKNVIIFLYSLLIVIFYLIISLPGILINSPFGLILNSLSEKERIKCQKESKVKVLGKDVVASYKLIIAVVCLPIQFIVITLFFFFLCPFFFPSLDGHRIMATFIFTLIFPVYNYIMILCTDRLWLHSKNLAGKFNAIFNEQQYQTLRSIRNNLQIQIREYVNEYGKEVFKNFEENKVLSEKKQQQALPSKQKPDIHTKIDKAMKRINSTELMQKIFSVLEDIGV